MRNFIVLAILGVVLFFAIRSIYKRHKNGTGCCDGDCGHCSGCH